MNIKLKGDRGYTWQKGFFYKNCAYLPIRKKEISPFEGIVYNLEVEESKSFVCEGMIVHNSEPLGLVAQEAMSCGTPVIATRDGAIPEVVLHGKTGFICDTEEEMVEAVKNIGKIDPLECRKRAEGFSRLNMAKNYEKLYYRVLNNDQW